MSADFLKHSLTEYLLHYIYIQQNKTGFSEKINCRDIIKTNRKDTFEEGNIKIGAIEIHRNLENYDLRYRYDWHRAIPTRRRFDYQRGGYVELVENAMTLMPDEYGRIIYNGRYTDFDTGGWYYNLDIVNSINLPNHKDIPSDIFSKREPNITYNQLAILH